MKLIIVCAGKIREQWIKDGLNEYLKRLSRFCTTEIREVPDAPDTIPVEQALEREGSAMLSQIKPSSVVWLMDLAGEPMTSEVFSAELIRAFEKGGAELVFVIGGSNGISPEVVARADRRINFSKMTFTHAMARIILLEQCYRAFKIAGGERYHK
jgi:23S rRNA (pseudouridine1915-N3)-methyltransferase